MTMPIRVYIVTSVIGENGEGFVEEVTDTLAKAEEYVKRNKGELFPLTINEWTVMLTE